LPKALSLPFVSKNGLSEIPKSVLHEQIPSYINRVLLGDAFAFKNFRKMPVLFDQYSIWDAGMVNVMDQGCEHTREASQRI
jgi:hypothetical protein